jgi:hypothetical protein
METAVYESIWSMVPRNINGKEVQLRTPREKVAHDAWSSQRTVIPPGWRTGITEQQFSLSLELWHAAYRAAQENNHVFHKK